MPNLSQTLTYSNYFLNILGLAECLPLSPLSRHSYTHVDFRGNLICVFRIHWGPSGCHCPVRTILGPSHSLVPFFHQPLNPFPSNQEAHFHLDQTEPKNSNIEVWFKPQNPSSPATPEKSVQAISGATEDVQRWFCKGRGAGETQWLDSNSL